MRDLMFGDVPLADWVKSGAQGEPWITLAAAERALWTDRDTARSRLESVLAMEGLETRQYLEAWHALRGLGVTPPEAVADQVLGVVVEVAMPEGLDVLGAYADHSARYWNYSGAGVVWERPDGRLDGPIDALLGCGQTLCGQIGTWDQPRLTDLPSDNARVSLLTPSALRFGQGPFDALAADELGGPVIAAATHLMQLLMALGSGGSNA